MSGGTDSSVAALLLQDAGYEVTGITFRFYEKENDTEYLEDARALCERLNIPHLTYDVRDTFRKTIIDYFINEYMAGHTPVPCTLCNNYLKWPLLKKISDEMGIYHFATGHYVRRRFINGCYHITTGRPPHTGALADGSKKVAVIGPLATPPESKAIAVNICVKKDSPIAHQ